MDQGPSFCAAVHARDGAFALFLDLDAPLNLKDATPCTLNGSFVIHADPTIGTLDDASVEFNPQTRALVAESAAGDLRLVGILGEDSTTIRGTLVYEGTTYSVTFESVDD